MIQRLTLFLAFLLPIGFAAYGQCTTTNATGCVCATSGQTDCDLLPDITISDWAILNYSNGPTEYSQSGNGANDGRLRISGSTPNIGFGSFTVGAVSMWTCGTDTFTTFPGTCPNGGGDPKQLIKQKIYHKNGNTMTYWERWAGSMTYHQTHGHMHVDEWAIFSLRIQDPNDPDPLNWPIVGTGAKVGFCLMDYGTCSYYSGHCRDANNNIMTNTSFPNYGLGGGNYNCSPVEQGISSGYTDIYGEHLDGMWIDIPPGTCNGDYYIVIEVDPNNNFLEANENNNVAAVPFTLTQQVPSGQGQASITAMGPTKLCDGETVTLQANASNSYLWSTGDTTASIDVGTSGTYTVVTTGPCGTGSDSIDIQVDAPLASPTVTDDDICEQGSATLTATGTGGDLNWYDAATGGSLIYTGPTYTTPMLNSTTTWHVEELVLTPGANGNVGPANSSIGTGAYHMVNTRYLEFDAHADMEIISVWVDAQQSGPRTVMLSDGAGQTITSRVVNMVQGPQRVTLNFQVPMGTNYRLGLSSSSTADLFRNNGGMNFPYDLGGIASITNSSAGSQYYYFYYDWEVKLPDHACSSPRSASVANVRMNPTPSFAGLAATVEDTDPPVALTGSPAGGVITGPGIVGNTFDPSLAGVGGPYTVTYTYTDQYGCTGEYTQDVTVTLSTGILDDVTAAAPIVYPNPNTGTFNLRFELLESHQVTVRILDLAGKAVQQVDLGQFVGKYENSFDLTGTAKGVYFVEVSVDQAKFFTKMIHQ